MKIARILAVLLLVALALAPLRMFGGEAAARPHQGVPMAMEHCVADADRPGKHEAPLSKAACAMACMAIPAVGTPLVERLRIPRAPDVASVISEPDGITPEAAVPPPRTV